MTLDTLYPTAPEAIDLREPEKPMKPQKVKEARGVNPMTSKLEIIKSAVILYLLIMGAWQTGWNVFCFVKPDATVFKNLKGMPVRDRAYMEAYLDACSMGNWFENKTTKCAVSGASLATLIKGEAVVAQIGLESLPLSEERKSWEAEADAAEVPAGNVQSPAN